MEVLITLILLYCVSCADVSAITSDGYTSRNASEMTLLPLDKSYTEASLLSCSARCTQNKTDCFNFIFDQSRKTCTLGYWLLPAAALNTTQPSSTTRLYTKGMYCNVHELVKPVGDGRMDSCSTSACQGFINVGDEEILVAKVPELYRTCLDVKNSTNPRQLVQLSSGLVVMCDTVTDGGGWTIFQRRVTGVVDFYRNWTEYKNGFGDYDIGDFYLGNENIYCLNLKNNYEFRVDINYNGANYFALYSNFSFLSEGQGYKLSVKGYSGTAGDSLSIVNNNQKFSTYDVDNDADVFRKCAVSYHAAWWYAACHYTNLNGLWGDQRYGMGLNWFDVTGDYGSVGACEMKLRPVK